MLSRIMGALSRRRTALKAADPEAGFTLVELLVVVIIIGILAAIAIPVYLGVQSSAKDNAVKADLTSIKTAIVAYQVQNPGATPALSDLKDTLNIDSSNYSGGAEPKISWNGTNKFCVDGSWASDHVFNITESTTAQNGACS